MYKLLLCSRYLRSRYIALASIVSVMLGVATMIVVNSVMSGFQSEMYKRLHGILSDIVVEAHSADGLEDHDVVQSEIRQIIGDDLEGMTTTVHVPAIVAMNVRGQWQRKQINLIGIDEKTYGDVGDFSQYLLHPENRQQLGFQLRESGYDPRIGDAGWPYRRMRASMSSVHAHQIDKLDAAREQRSHDVDLATADIDAASESEDLAVAAAVFEGSDRESTDSVTTDYEIADFTNLTGDRTEMTEPPIASDDADESFDESFESFDEAGDLAGEVAADQEADAPLDIQVAESGSVGTDISVEPEFDPAELEGGELQDGFDLDPDVESPFITADAEEAQMFDPSKEQWTGIVLGMAISNIRHRKPDGEVADFFMCKPGDDVIVTFASAGSKPQAINANFTVVDFYESKMSEYDSTFAFVPLSYLQKLRGMIDPATGATAVSSIQIKLREDADLDAVCEKLRHRFPPQLFPYSIQTWKEMQGPLLAAVQMETTILNILLFLIIAVAGFGILATFFMIVVEKTRDIGILKSLGASKSGVMSIFISYGFSLGVVGAGVGTVLGLLFVGNINKIAELLESITGREVFDPTIYYFQEIPTIINPLTVLWISVCAMLIAVTASVLPAMRAARMHPVEALRYE